MPIVFPNLLTAGHVSFAAVWGRAKEGKERGPYVRCVVIGVEAKEKQNKNQRGLLRYASSVPKGDLLGERPNEMDGALQNSRHLLSITDGLDLRCLHISRVFLEMMRAEHHHPRDRRRNHGLDVCVGCKKTEELFPASP